MANVPTECRIFCRPVRLEDRPGFLIFLMDGKPDARQVVGLFLLIVQHYFVTFEV